MKPVLIDTSSAILLYKAGIMDAFFSSYAVNITPSVYGELIHEGYDGAEDFREFVEKGKINVVQPASEGKGKNLPDNLDMGERETIASYLDGYGAFIVIDDKKGAGYLRRHEIPYVNALLIPRLLFEGQVVSENMFMKATEFLMKNGRYAGWIKTYASDCPSDALSFFIL